MTLDKITFTRSDSRIRSKVREAIDEHGCALIADLYDKAETQAIQDAASDLEARAMGEDSEFYKEGSVWAIKSVFDLSSDLARLTQTRAFASLLTATVDDDPMLLHAATMMGKRGGETEPVAWHQDNGIPVDRDLHDERRKGVREGGVPYRFGTKDVLDLCIECRVHVDIQREEGGCLVVMPGSHRWEVMDYDGVAEKIGDQPGLACPAPAGSALIFRPMLAHMSHPPRKPLPDGESRRTIQIQYAAESAKPEKGLNFYRWKQPVRLTPDGAELQPTADCNDA
jgi:ectoine hydroxylase-related dioxygenase (phytanoyl-CoA dioxygenase family)